MSEGSTTSDVAEAAGRPAPGPGPGPSPSPSPSAAPSGPFPAGPGPLPAGLDRPAAVSVGFTAGGAPARVVPTRRFSAAARSPLVPFVVAVVASLVALATVRWFLGSTSTGNDSGPTAFQWTVLTEVLLGLENLDLAGADRSRGWWAVAALAVAAVAVVAWLVRLGGNARFESGSFGAPTVLAAVPAWWVLAFEVGDRPSDSLGEVRLRFTLALVILVVQGIVARWTFCHRLWESGRLPMPLVSFVLWVPNLVALGWFLAATTFSYYSFGEGERPESSWEPTQLMADLARWANRGTGLAVVAVAVAVTISQHLGILADRHEHAEAARP